MQENQRRMIKKTESKRYPEGQFDWMFQSIIWLNVSLKMSFNICAGESETNDQKKTGTKRYPVGQFDWMFQKIILLNVSLKMSFNICAGESETNDPKKNWIKTIPSRTIWLNVTKHNPNKSKENFSEKNRNGPFEITQIHFQGRRLID